MASAAGCGQCYGNTGGILGTTIVTLGLEPVLRQVARLQYIFAGLACTTVLSTFWIFLVPDMVQAGR